MKKVFLDDLPRRNGKTNQINWNKCVGYKVHFIYDDVEGDIDIISYYPSKKELSVKYKDDDIFKINSSSFARCLIGNIIGKKTSKFKYSIGQIFKDDKRDIIITNKTMRKRFNKDGVFKCNDKWYEYYCNKCGAKLWMIESGIRRQGCSCCRGLTVVENINSIVVTAPWMIKYFQNPEDAKKYTKTSSVGIYPICPDCGRVKNKRIAIREIYKYNSIACSCSDKISYPLKFMSNIMCQINIYFKNEKRFSWCKYQINNKYKYGIYDFYIPSMNLIIEMDGSFHYKDNNMNGQTAEESKVIDDYKDKIAKEHGIEVIRIDCDYEHEDRFEYVKNNVIEKLKDVFDLSKIDWIKAEDFANKNLTKVVCEYKRSNPKLSTGDISKLVGIVKSTVIKYLKIGNKLGWCDYNTKSESLQNIERCKKPVEILKDNISLGVFPSMTELARQSEKLFGIKLSLSCISAVCLGRQEKHKNFVFKFNEN